MPSRLRLISPDFRDESLAPEVDENLIDALIRQELAGEDARLVYRLIESFKSWSDAHEKILVRDFRSRHGADQ